MDDDNCIDASVRQFICLFKSHFDVQSTNTYLHIKHIVIHQTVLNRTTRDYTQIT